MSLVHLSCWWCSINVRTVWKTVQQNPNWIFLIIVMIPWLRISKDLKNAFPIWPRCIALGILHPETKIKVCRYNINVFKISFARNIYFFNLYTILAEKKLWVMKISTSKSNETLIGNIKLIANIHGNEAVGKEVLLHFIEVG